MPVWGEYKGREDNKSKAKNSHWMRKNTLRIMSVYPSLLTLPLPLPLTLTLTLKPYLNLNLNLNLNPNPNSRVFLVDAAILRRMPRTCHIDLPDAQQREAILTVLLRSERVGP
jgi:hypothetical protein